MILDPGLTAAYIVLAAALALSPGPDVMFVVANGMIHKAKGAIASAFGIGAGSFLHAILAAIGVSAVIAASPVAFEIMKIAGALYLAWLGIQASDHFCGTLERPTSLKKSTRFQRGRSSSAAS